LRNAVIDASVKNADASLKAADAAMKAAEAVSILAARVEKPHDGQ